MTSVVNSAKSSVTLLLLAAVACLLSLPGAGAAADATPNVRAVDAVIVLDDSLSMAACWPWTEGVVRYSDCAGVNPPSDPGRLRYSAARLLVQLADDEDRIAVIRFDTTVEPVAGGQLQLVRGPDSRKALIGVMNAPTTYEQRANTRIDKGLQQAANIMLNRTDTSRPGYILLLTDGDPEPVAPTGEPTQEETIRSTMQSMSRTGVTVFPITLCSGGCPDDSLLRRYVGTPRQAHNPSELLLVFSTIFAEMKPTLHIIGGQMSADRNADGNIRFFTRLSQGTSRISVITPRNGFLSLDRNGKPETAEPRLEDENISVHVLESNSLPVGTWVVKSREQSGFVVARTDSYPELVYPPAAVSNSAASPHYFPADRQNLLVVASISGPGGETLFMDGTAPLKLLNRDGSLYWIVLPGGLGNLQLQLGSGSQPLRVARSFRLLPLPSAPLLTADTPTCTGKGSCTLSARFALGADVQGMQGSVFVFEGSGDEEPVYSHAMTCTDRRCADTGFQAISGRPYKIRFLVQARTNGVLFGDWAETSLEMKPSVQLLRSAYDFGTVQYDTSSNFRVDQRLTTTLQFIGQTFPVTVRQGESSCSGMQLSLESPQLQADGSYVAGLRLQSSGVVQPGVCSGVFSFQAPSAEYEIQQGQGLRWQVAIQKPSVQLLQSSYDFGTVQYDTSPNFLVDQRLTTTLHFVGPAFPMTVKQGENPPAGLQLNLESSQMQADGSHVAGLRLRSSGVVQPGVYSGTFSLQASSPECEIRQGQGLFWQVSVKAIEWKLSGVRSNGQLTNRIDFGSVGSGGGKGSVTLRVSYTGKPSFKLHVRQLGPTDTSRGREASADIQIALDPPVPDSSEAMTYDVPVHLLVKRTLAQDLFRSDIYTGTLYASIEGLPADKEEAVDFAFRRPSVFEQYIRPPLATVFHLPLPGTAVIGVPLLVVAITRQQRKAAETRRILEDMKRRAASSGSTATRGAAPLPQPPPRPRNAVHRPSGSPVFGRFHAMSASRPYGGLNHARPRAGSGPMRTALSRPLRPLQRGSMASTAARSGARLTRPPAPPTSPARSPSTARPGVHSTTWQTRAPLRNASPAPGSGPRARVGASPWGSTARASVRERKPR